MHTYLPQLTLLHQDSRGNQHIVAHSLDLARKGLVLNTTTQQQQQHNQQQQHQSPTTNSTTTIAYSIMGGNNNYNYDDSNHHHPSPPPPNARLKKSHVEGGSGIIIPVPPIGYHDTTSHTAAADNNNIQNNNNNIQNNNRNNNIKPTIQMGGVLILGQRQITYHSTSEGLTKILPIAPSLILAYHYIQPVAVVQDDENRRQKDHTVRYILGDEKGNLQLLAITRTNLGKVTGLHLEVLGVTSVPSCITYLDKGLIYIASQMGDSQFIKILEEPIIVDSNFNSNTAQEEEEEQQQQQQNNNNNKNKTMSPSRNMTYVHVLEEYTNLGPIVDFDLVPTNQSTPSMSPAILGKSSSYSSSSSSSLSHNNTQSMIVTASGTGKHGTIREIRNGNAMVVHASVPLGGINSMWRLRRSFYDQDDTFLIQSYVGETRILGVVYAEEEEEDEDEEDEKEDWNVMNSRIDESSSNRSMDVSNQPMEAEDESNMSGASAVGTLEEIQLNGLDSTRSTLYAGNINVEISACLSLFVQITELEIRLIDAESGEASHIWSPPMLPCGEDSHCEDEEPGLITVAACNESGQMCIALRGGSLLYLQVLWMDGNPQTCFKHSTKLEREISCINLNPFDCKGHTAPSKTMMGINECDEAQKTKESRESSIVVVGLWDESCVHVLSLEASSPLMDIVCIGLGSEDGNDDAMSEMNHHYTMIRSLCLVTLDSSSTVSSRLTKMKQVNMLLVGLGDGGLISYVVDLPYSNKNDTRVGDISTYKFHSRKEVNLGTRGIDLEPFQNADSGGNTCILATGDRPTVIYLTGGGGGSNTNPKLCYSNINLSCLQSNNPTEDQSRGKEKATQENLIANAATPFESSLLFPSNNPKSYSLCISDESTLFLGTIDDIQKLHITTHKLKMTPRRIAHHQPGRAICVGCIDDSKGFNSHIGGEVNMGNCIRFFDDKTFEEFDRFDLDPYEMMLSMISTSLRIKNSDITYENVSFSGPQSKDYDQYNSFIVVGTAYCYPEEDEPTRGRILLIDCSTRKGDTSNISSSSSSLFRTVKMITELQTKGGVYSMCSFYDGALLVTVNSKTLLCELVNYNKPILEFAGLGHHGHILSLFVKSLANKNRRDFLTKDKARQVHGEGGTEEKQLAIVGDLMRSISLIEYHPQYQSIQEIARDYNQNWTTAIEMLNDEIYLGSENFHNLFVLKHNSSATTDEMRCRLDTVGLFNLGEMPNKFMSGTLVMPTSTTSSIPSSKTPSEKLRQVFRPNVQTGSQTLYATVDGTIGSIIGLDAKSATFFAALEYSMARTIKPIGNLDHHDFRAYRSESRQQPSQGFIDGDLVESFLDLDKEKMELIVTDMNIGQSWNLQANMNKDGNHIEQDDSYNHQDLSVNDIIAMVEEISLLH